MTDKSKLDVERELFEKFFRAIGFDLTRFECAVPQSWSAYADQHTGFAWAGFQAGRASMSTKLTALESAVQKVHAAKGRYYTQIAMCDLYDLVSLPNVRFTRLPIENQSPIPTGQQTSKVTISLSDKETVIEALLFLRRADSFATQVKAIKALEIIQAIAPQGDPL